MEIVPRKEIIIRLIVALGLKGNEANDLLHSCGLDVSYGKFNEPFRCLINGPNDEEKSREDFYEEYWANELLFECGIPKEKCYVKILSKNTKS